MATFRIKSGESLTSDAKWSVEITGTFTMRIAAMVDTQSAHAGQLRSEATLDVMKIN